ncbi:MAG TPA: thioredoxin family protein [Pyrinomonadaceae bacterium]|nr:thioredoxin family protein [Pyrinomonadaceae bacterium]
MKGIFTAFFILLFSTLVTIAQTEGIVWEKDFKKAQQAARASGKPLLLDFTAVWCKPCQMMDKEFWVREDVIEASKPFIAVKIDFDSDKGVVSKYGVSAIPFVVFTDPLGNLITFRRGFSKKNVQELNMIFDEMPKDFSPMIKLYDALDLKKDDGIALFKIANAYRGAKMLRLSNDFYRKALKTSEIQADSEKKTNAYLSLGVNYLNLKDFKQAVEIMEDFLKTKPSGEFKESALYFLVFGSANNDKMKDADKYLQMLKTEFPASANIAQAEAVIERVKNQPKKEK